MRPVGVAVNLSSGDVYVTDVATHSVVERTSPNGVGTLHDLEEGGLRLTGAAEVAPAVWDRPLRRQPVDLLEQGQKRLGRGMTHSKEAGLLDLPHAMSVGFESHAILRQCRDLVYVRQRLAPQPDRDPRASEPPFAVQPPMPEALGAAAARTAPIRAGTRLLSERAELRWGW